MPLPRFVIAGRPNVGKSSLFNWLVGTRVAIVDDQPGVTRDRITRIVQEDDRYLELIDTGGMGIRDVDDLTEEIERQIQIGIQEADAILLVVDVHEGLQPSDQEAAIRLRRLGKPVLLVVNKADGPSHDAAAEDFRRLGFPDLAVVSTKANRNRQSIWDWIVAHLPPEDEGSPPSAPELKVAIVGRRNVGKSTFVNTLACSERMIVSEVPGTTRDSVDVRFELDGKVLIAIDTPGLRKSKSVRTDIDFYSTTRAHESIRRADVVLLFFDATEPVSRVDKKLCGYIEEHYKPSIFVVNKWDLYHDQVPSQEWVDYLRDEFRGMHHAPIAFITGQSGQNVKTLVNHTQMLHKQARSRISTGQLNTVIRAAV
ncbi:MAG TPA: ribosome biogenesis GTPase Der, partial [Pirellulaceae bacterium]